jgi:hypothetical protein
LKDFLAETLCKAVIDKIEAVAPNFSEEEIGSI